MGRESEFLMPVSNAHLAETVQVWDGMSFSTIDIKLAKKWAKQGRVQIAGPHCRASDLKPSGYFSRDSKAEDNAEPEKLDKRTKEYKTRQLKAEI